MGKRQGFWNFTLKKSGTTQQYRYRQGKPRGTRVKKKKKNEWTMRGLSTSEIKVRKMHTDTKAANGQSK